MLPDVETQSDRSIASWIRSRRTIHNFTQELPSDALLEEAIDLACQAPNHKLTEPWRFYFIGPATQTAIIERNTALITELKGEAAAINKQKRWKTMPGWLVVTSQRSANEVRDLEDYAAVCCAVQNLTLFLWSEGVGVKWASGPVTRDAQFYDIVGIDGEEERVVGLFFYGYPAEIPTSPRKPGTEQTKKLP